MAVLLLIGIIIRGVLLPMILGTNGGGEFLNCLQQAVDSSKNALEQANRD